MNIENLVEAAKEIDRLAALNEAKAATLVKLAADARKAKTDMERNNIQFQARQISMGVVDFGNAVAMTRKALKAKPTPKGGPA